MKNKWTFKNKELGDEIFKAHKFDGKVFVCQPNNVRFEMIIKANDDESLKNLFKFKSNWFRIRKIDWFQRTGIIETACIPFDIATKKETYSDLFSRLKKIAKSWDENCDVYVTLNRKGLSDEQIAKISYFFNNFVVMEHYALRVLGRCEPTGLFAVINSEFANNIKPFSEVLLKKKKYIKMLENEEIKRVKNYRSPISLSEENITFKMARGSFRENRIVSIIKFWNSVIEYVKSTKWHELDSVKFTDILLKDENMRVYLC